jgi:hypothetical protein
VERPKTDPTDPRLTGKVGQVNGPAKTLVGVRAAIGGGAWLAPRLSGRMFGLDPEANPQAAYLGRLFGIRDAVLAAGTASNSGRAQAQWLQLGIVCDLADAMAGVLAGRRGELPAKATVMVTLTALAAAGLGVAALQGAEQAA